MREYRPREETLPKTKNKPQSKSGQIPNGWKEVGCVGQSETKTKRKLEKM